jgi:hypothetical protein
VVAMPLWQFGPRFRRAVGFLAALALMSFDAGAQGTYSLQGFVRNESGRPVEQAQVLLNPGAGQRELRSDRDGAFRFLGISPGSHELRILRIGFQPRDTTVTIIAGSTNEVIVSLTRLTSLREVAVSARRTGVYGIVLERDSLKPIEGARVELLGGRAGDTTDASGAFSMMAARSGTFLLRVSHPMFDTRMVSVRAPVDSGVEIDIVMRPGGVPLPNTLEFGLADMAQRVNWATGAGNATIVGRDELRDRGSLLEMALKLSPSVAKKGLMIDERACVFVDGVARPLLSINAVSAEDIESVEVYGARGDFTGTLAKMWPRGAICGNPNARAAPTNRAIFIAIWTRR